MLEQKYRRLTKEIDSLESKKEKARDLENQVRILTRASDKHRQEIKNLQKKKIRLMVLMNSGQYKKIRQIVEEEVTNILSKSRDLLKLATNSVIESTLRDPTKYNFLVNSSLYNGGQYAASQPYIDAYRALILNEAQKYF